MVAKTMPHASWAVRLVGAGAGVGVGVMVGVDVVIGAVQALKSMAAKITDMSKICFIVALFTWDYIT